MAPHRMSRYAAILNAFIDWMRLANPISHQHRCEWEYGDKSQKDGRQIGVNYEGAFLEKYLIFGPSNRVRCALHQMSHEVSHAQPDDEYAPLDD